MDLRHKHHALIWIGVLSAAFLAIVTWFLLRSEQTETIPLIPPVATSTPEGITAPARTLNESNEFYEVSARYPSATPLSEEANEAAVATMEAYIRSQAREFSANASVGLMSPEDAAIAFPDGRKYTLDIDYTTVSGPRSVSYVFTQFSDTLGAHPNTTFRTFTFDTETGTQLALSDLFQPGSQYLERLSIRTRNELSQTMIERSGSTNINQDMLTDGTRPVAESFQWFRIEGNSLIFMFPPYQVAPYVFGLLEVNIPLAELRDTLKPEYQP